MRLSDGFTLLEALVSMTVVAILAALAAPAFASFHLDAKRTATVNEFFHSVFLARSEAAKRGEVASVCRSEDGNTCASREVPWTVGWIVFVNLDRDEPAERDPNEPLLAVYGAREGVTITSNRVTYSFRPTVQGVVNGTIVFCDRRGSEHARAIIISHTGRPRVARRDASGRALPCP
ncbi:MAG: prepilin-type N-terminal cleavage/methylation domain-containing protein [Xanthomonadaceae bacterium]|nr:prepilin-type N-terminal cleavage/methylation domain-containing protein [Xanthomonadaceae bacterium]